MAQEDDEGAERAVDYAGTARPGQKSHARDYRKEGEHVARLDVLTRREDSYRKGDDSADGYP